MDFFSRTDTALGAGMRLFPVTFLAASDSNARASIESYEWPSRRRGYTVVDLLTSYRRRQRSGGRVTTVRPLCDRLAHDNYRQKRRMYAPVAARRRRQYIINYNNRAPNISSPIYSTIILWRIPQEIPFDLLSHSNKYIFTFRRLSFVSRSNRRKIESQYYTLLFIYANIVLIKWKFSLE